MNAARYLFVIIAALGLAAAAVAAEGGCTKKTAVEPDPPDAGGPAPSAASATPVALPSADPNAPKLDDTLFGRLNVENQSRPKVTPNADDVFAALDKAGVGTLERKQSLGKTYKAAYCTGAYTKDMSVAVDVCEYADEAAAKTGLDYAKTLFPGMTNRAVWGHKSTLLITINQKGDPAGDVRAKKIGAIYMGL
jgi:hypothetical protein